ncbi:MAG: PD-(D/E)XK nuclease family protein, partial [Caulobacteraceae bacterium]
ELVRAGAPRGSLARERALALNVAPWVVAFERRRRDGARLLVEQQGVLTLPGRTGPFRLTARADRIEVRGARADVLDFKTGSAPSAKQVRSGLSPQLTLTAAILLGGGFEQAGRLEAGDLVYVRVSGGRTPGREEIRAAAPESADLALRALEGLQRRVLAFDDESAAYLSWAAPQFVGRHGGDYDHLARLWEWGVIGADGETLAEAGE